MHTHGKRKANPIMILSIRFTKLIIHHLQSKHKFHPRPDSPLHLPYEVYILGYLKFSTKGTKREVFGVPIPNELITPDIRGEQHYKEYLEKVAKHQRYIAGEEGSDPDSLAPKPAKATKKSKPSAPKAALVTKPAAAKASKSTSSQQPKPKPTPAKTQEKKRIPEREPRFDDKEADMQRAVEESLKSVHDAHRGLLPPVVFREPDSGKFQSFSETSKKMSPAKQYIFQRRTLAPIEPSCHVESPSIYAELGLTDNDTEFDDEGLLWLKLELKMKARLDQTLVYKLKARLDQTLENLKLTVKEHVILEEPASSTGTLSSLQHLAKDFLFGDQFFNDKPSEAENKKTTAKTEAESIGSVTIHQDTSAIPLMTSPVIDLICRPDSPNDHRPLLATVSKEVDEIVIDVVDWAIQGPLRNRFKDLPEADMKEILHQRMWETNSYIAHEDHMMLYEALEKSMNRDHTDELLTDLAEARRKKKKRHDLPKTLPGSPPHQPSPPPPLAAWTTTDTRLKPSILTIPQDLHMDNDTALDEQVHSSDDEDMGNAHIPKYQMEKCHKLLTNKLDESIIRLGVSKIRLQGWQTYVVNLEDEGGYYLDVGLEQMVPDQMWIEEECKYDIAAMYGISHWCSKDNDSTLTDTYLRLGIESYQTQLNLTKPRWDATGFEYKHDFTVIDSPRAVTFRDKYGVQMIMRFNKIHKFSDGTLHQIDEALDYRVKEFKVNRMNSDLNTRFWTRKYVDRSKEFMFSIQKRLKTKRIFRNLESFIGG
nr:E-beta-farnesene synthase [Tanacetum cinerariifolium]